VLVCRKWMVGGVEMDQLLPIWIRHCVNTQLGHSSAKNLGKSTTAGSEEVPMFDASC
jgi:hypothetical protein